jgi:hypothetical protein
MSDPTVRRLLRRLRAGERPSLREHSSQARLDVIRALLADLQPGDHALAVWLLEQEIAEVAGDTAASVGLPETLSCLIAAVARFARPEDALVIWRAAQATPEARLGVDVEQALRAGPDAVRRALRQRIARGGSRTNDAAAALAWVEDGIANGAANDLPAYFAWSDERYGLHVSGPT